MDKSFVAATLRCFVDGCDGIVVTDEVEYKKVGNKLKITFSCTKCGEQYVFFISKGSIVVIAMIAGNKPSGQTAH